MIFVLLNIISENIPAGDGLGRLSLKEPLPVHRAALQQSPTEARLQEPEAPTMRTQQRKQLSIFLTQD